MLTYLFRSFRNLGYKSFNSTFSKFDFFSKPISLSFLIFNFKKGCNLCEKCLLCTVDVSLHL